jgi:hypothetical protein
MQAYTFGVYDHLFNECNISRDEIFNMFEDWGRQFEMIEQQHKDDIKWYYYDEIDAFVNKKFEEIKLSHLFPCGIAIGDYLTYEGGLYKITGFEDDAIVVDEIRPGTDKDWIVCSIGFSQVDKIKILDTEEVMDTTNGHNPELVEKINRAWTEKREKFYPILCALYKRDNDEIRDSDAFIFTEEITRNYDTIYEYLKENWDIEAGNYLQHIADDTDLKTILTFIRYEE